MFSPQVVETSQVTTAAAHRHSISLRRFRRRDLVLVRFSDRVILPIGWRRHGELAWRIMRPKDAYLTVRTVDRIPLTIDVEVIRGRTFDDRNPFRAYRRQRRITKTVVNAEFEDTVTGQAKIRAPEYGTQIIVKTIDYVHPDPEIDRQGSYKTGYSPVSVSYAAKLGRLERKRQWMAEGNDPNDWHGKTAILRLPAVGCRQFSNFALSQTEDDDGQPLVDEDEKPVTYRRRRWSINLDLMPSWVRNALQEVGEATISYADLRAYLRRIRDAAQYRDAD